MTSVSPLPNRLARCGLCLLVGAWLLGGAIPAGATPSAPRKDWRLVPLDAVHSGGESDLRAAALERRDGSFVPAHREPWFAFRLPRTPTPTLLTFQWTPKRRSKTKRIRWRAEISDGTLPTKPWSPLGRGRARRYFLAKVEVPPADAPRWVRVSFKHVPSLRLTDVGLYRLDEGGANDYWVFVGASIQAWSIRNHIFKRMVRDRFGYDPVVFNRAKGGDIARNLRSKLPRILREHPRARYVAIHVGGNDVSEHRPYPGGAEDLEKELVRILKRVRKAGKIPILARLSYRRYVSQPVVPPNDNGSGPYVRAIYDPLIRKYCPRFYDRRRRRGVVDPYNYYRRRPRQLTSDGIHPTAKGRENWNRLWAEQAGQVVYGSPAP